MAKGPKGRIGPFATAKEAKAFKRQLINAGLDQIDVPTAEEVEYAQMTGFGLPAAVHDYISAEVRRQGDIPSAVMWMAAAWLKSIQDHKAGRLVTPELIASWGKRVKPTSNAGGFRSVAVSVAWSPPASRVYGMVKGLCIEALAAINDAGRVSFKDADRIYRDFEMIHPFTDGNGRTGKILLNYMLDSLEAPVMPSNHFNCANP